MAKTPQEPGSVRQQFGKLISDAIGTRKVAAVARAIGAHRPNLAMAMEGERLLTDEQLVALAEFCGVDIEALIPKDVDLGDLAKKVWTARQLWAERQRAPRTAPLPPRPTTERMSGSDRSVASLPPGLEAFLAHNPRLHPAVRHHLQLNHDLRTEGWVERDEAFWADFAAYFAKRLRVPLEEEGGEKSPSPPRKGKG